VDAGVAKVCGGRGDHCRRVTWSVPSAAARVGSILHGVWLLEGNGILLRLGADGSYAIDDGGELITDPDDEGTFEVDGESGTLTFTSGADSRTCAEDDVWVWTNAQLGEECCGWSSLRKGAARTSGRTLCGSDCNRLGL
jgi:hypothetical protein